MHGTLGLWFVSIFGEDEFPFAKKVILSPADVERLEKPDPRKHGLLPFVIKRLKHLQPEIEQAGYKIRFAVARGPLNIASFLMGTTEFMEAIKTDPELMHQLLTIVTDFLVEWIGALPCRAGRVYMIGASLFADDENVRPRH